MCFEFFRINKQKIDKKAQLVDSLQNQALQFPLCNNVAFRTQSKSKMELLVKINNFQRLTILAKRSILDARLASGCVSVQTYVLIFYLKSPEYRKGLKSRANGLKILTGKKYPKIKLLHLRKIRIWTFGSLVLQINSF